MSRRGGENEPGIVPKPQEPPGPKEVEIAKGKVVKIGYATAWLAERVTDIRIGDTEILDELAEYAGQEGTLIFRKAT